MPTHRHIYDFTVEDTKTFCIFNGLCCMDSFHTAGIGSISQVTQGVPRLKELLSLSKKIKTPQMAIVLTKDYSASRETAKKISSYIEHVSLKHILNNIRPVYDPYLTDINKLMKEIYVKSKKK